MIKNMGPNYNGAFKQGYFNPQNPEKYIGDPTKIIMRSSWESRFASWCDLHPKIKRWGSEPIEIPYISPLDSRKHRYYVDFYIEVEKPEGVQSYLVEIKPNLQFQPPDQKLLEGNKTLSKMKRYNWQLKTYIVNKAKFETAVIFAKSRGWKFVIADENFLF